MPLHETMPAAPGLKTSLLARRVLMWRTKGVWLTGLGTAVAFAAASMALPQYPRFLAAAASVAAALLGVSVLLTQLAGRKSLLVSYGTKAMPGRFAGLGMVVTAGTLLPVVVGALVFGSYRIDALREVRHEATASHPLPQPAPPAPAPTVPDSTRAKNPAVPQPRWPDRPNGPARPVQFEVEPLPGSSPDFVIIQGATPGIASVNPTLRAYGSSAPEPVFFTGATGRLHITVGATNEPVAWEQFSMTTENVDFLPRLNAFSEWDISDGVLAWWSPAFPVKDPVDFWALRQKALDAERVFTHHAYYYLNDAEFFIGEGITLSPKPTLLQMPWTMNSQRRPVRDELLPAAGSYEPVRYDSPED